MNAPPTLIEPPVAAQVDWAEVEARQGSRVDPEATWRCLQVAIDEYRFLEQRSAHITDQAHRLLDHARMERQRTKDRIDYLEGALAASEAEAAAARRSAQAAEEAARAADGAAQAAALRLAEAERQTDSLVNLCLDLLETIEPMVAQGFISIGSRDSIIVYLRTIAQRPRYEGAAP